MKKTAITAMPRPIQILSLIAVAAAAFFLGRLSNEQSELANNPGQETTGGEDGPRAKLSANKPAKNPSATTNAGAGEMPVTDDPVATLREALNSPTNIGRQRAFASALLSMRPEDGPGVHQLFLDGDAQGRYFYGEWGDFWTRWGEIDPLGAVEYINSGALGEHQMGTSTSAVLPSIGHQGEDAARAFLETINLDEAAGNQSATAVIGGLAEVDLDAATRIALANAEAPFFGQVADTITEAAVQSGGLENLKSWFDDLPEDSPMRKAAMHSVLNRVGRAGIEAQREWINHLANSTAKPIAPSLIGSHAHSSMSEDPIETIEWLDRFSDSEDYKNILPSAFSTWSNHDRAAANAWLDANQERPDYDNIASLNAISLQLNDMQSALQRASTIKDEATRERIVGILKKTQEKLN